MIKDIFISIKDKIKSTFNKVTNDKKLLGIVIASFLAVIIATTTIIVCVINFGPIDISKMSQAQLDAYYNGLYGNYDALGNLSDEELKAYYENLYGVGGNDLSSDEDGYTSSTTTVYNFDDENDNRYTEYMSLNYSKAYMIRDASSKVTYGSDHQGDLVSLVLASGETKFTNGIAIAGAAACFTYTDIRQQGYEEFSGYFGAHYLARYTNSTSTSFNFRFMCDGVTVLTTSTFNKDTQAEYVSIDLTNVEVFQIFVEIQGSGTGDYMAMGDPKFTKAKATPYLSVFDLEFNLPSQVTAFNFLEFAKAYDINNNNISSSISYETDYVMGSGATGQYTVTYIVSQTVLGELVTRRDTVVMDVYNIDYSEVWSVEDFKKPYVNHLYQARQGYSPQMKKLFDFILEDILDFDDSEWIKKYRSNIYTSQNAKRYNFYAEGIYLNYSEINTIINGLTDSDSRTIMLLDVDLMGSYYATVDSTTGLTSYCWFWAENLTTEQYDARIEQMLTNSEMLLAYAKDDMTYAQKWKYVTDAYSNNIKYTDGGSMYNAIGLFQGKCNGNSRGLVYLAQRLSIRSIYANGSSSAGFHAWSYQQLPDDNNWYMTDKLWGSTLGSATSHGHAVYTGYGYVFPTVSATSYSSYNYTYPSIWMTFTLSSFSVSQGTDVEVLKNVSGIDGIFSDAILKSTYKYSITNESGNTVSNSTSSLAVGSYTITYTLNYVSNLYNFTREYTIPLEIT